MSRRGFLHAIFLAVVFFVVAGQPSPAEPGDAGSLRKEIYALDLAARNFLSSGDYKSALTRAQEARQKALLAWPEEPERVAPYHFLSGRASFGAGDLTGSMQHLNLAVETSDLKRGVKVEALILRGQLHSALKQMELSLADLDEAWRFTGSDYDRSEILLSKVTTLRNGGATEEALALAQETTTQPPFDDPECCKNVMARLHWFQGRTAGLEKEFDKAQDHLGRAVEIARTFTQTYQTDFGPTDYNPALKRYLFDSASFDFNDHRIGRAYSALEEASGLFPIKGELQGSIYYLQARLNAYSGNSLSASTSFKMASDEFLALPNISAPVLEKVVLQEQKAAFDFSRYQGPQALEAIDQVIQEIEERGDTATSGYYEAVYLKADILSVQGAYGEAERQYQLILTSGFDALRATLRTSTLISLSDLYQEQGLTELCLPLLDRAFSLMEEADTGLSSIDLEASKIMGLGLASLVLVKRAHVKSLLQAPDAEVNADFDMALARLNKDQEILAGINDDGRIAPFRTMERIAETLALILTHTDDVDAWETQINELVTGFGTMSSNRIATALSQIQLSRAQWLKEQGRWEDASAALFSSQQFGFETSGWHDLRVQRERAWLEYLKDSENYGYYSSGAMRLVEMIEWTDNHRVATQRLSYRQNKERRQMLADALTLLVHQREVEIDISSFDPCEGPDCPSRDGFSFVEPYYKTFAQTRIELAWRTWQIAAQNSAAEALTKLSARLAAGSGALAGVVRQQQDQFEKRTRIQAQLREASAVGRAWKGPAPADLQAELAQADEALAAIDQTLRDDFPRFAELMRPAPLTYTEMRDLLREGEAVVGYFLDDANVYGFLVTPEKAVWEVLPGDKATIEGLVQTLRKGLDPTGGQTRGMAFDYEEESLAGLPFDRDAAHQLYSILIAPFEAELETTEHLFVVSDGALTSLPFSVLVTAPPIEAFAKDTDDLIKTPWLLRDKAITTLPSVSSLRILRVFGDDVRGQGFGGVGDPQLGGAGAGKDRNASPVPLMRGGTADVSLVRALAPLPETADELTQIAKHFGAKQSRLFLGAAANEKDIRQGALEGFAVVAFATHGLIAGELKGLAEPALVLTPPESASPENDGLLTASEVAELKLVADWVLLSACNTAAGDSAEGAEGLSGLARSFFYAGATSMLVSHWPVESRAAVELTTGTFSALEQDPQIGRSEALRRAMLRLADGTAGARYAHPSLWAPFVLVGEGGADTE